MKESDPPADPSAPATPAAAPASPPPPHGPATGEDTRDVDAAATHAAQGGPPVAADALADPAARPVEAALEDAPPATAGPAIGEAPPVDARRVDAPKFGTRRPVANGDSTASAPAAPAGRERRCENCGTVLLGEHCYACGQPTRGLVRHFGSILGDFLDTVFNVDQRVVRTLAPLLLRPGHLSNEYFEGRRVRYVSPVRLFVFLSILAFLAAQWSLTITGGGGDDGPDIRIGGDGGGDFDRATTPEAVIAARDRALKELEEAKREGAAVPGLAAGMDAAAREIAREADVRVAELRRDAAKRPPPGTAAPAGAPAPKRTAASDEAPTPAAPSAPAAPVAPSPGTGPPPDAGPAIDDGGEFTFNGKAWDEKTNPIDFGWLPAAGDTRVNHWIGRAKANVKRLKDEDDPNLLKDAFLSVVPQTLFVLLPLFALLLKVLYVFKKRLYMEHLVVALHSHAFLCLVLLLQSLLSLLESAVTTEGAALATAFGWVEGLLWLWAPVYLLLMQKRVYRQGWPATLFKFALIGLAYVILLSVAAAVAMAVSLVVM